MAKRYGKANKLSDSIEIPFTPDVFQVTSSEPMPIEPPDTSSLTAMPELFPPTVIAEDIDWRQHPKWKPLISTPSRSTPIPKGTLVPDPSPACTFSDAETSTLMNPSPAGSYIHRRRQGEYVKRPPVWSLNGLGGENSSHLPENKDPGFDTSARDEDIPFPLKVSTNLPGGPRHVSKESRTLSNLNLPSYSCEDQLKQMATAFTTEPFIVNVAQDMTYTNLSRLEESTGRASPGPIIQQWVRSTPPPQEESIERSFLTGTTGSCIDLSPVEPSYAVISSVGDQGRNGLGLMESEAPIENADPSLPSVGQVIRSDSDGPLISPGDSASAFRHRAHIERSTESPRANRYETPNRYRDIRTAPPVPGDMEYGHWIVLGSRVTCVEATTIAVGRDNDDHFELTLGHQYLVSKIFDDQWALCIRCDTHENLRIHQYRKPTKSIRKKIMHTLRSNSKKPIHMEKVKYDRHIINFLPLCAVTLEANYAAYLETSGSTSSTTNSSSSRTRVMRSQRSPPEGGVAQAPKRDSSQREAHKIRVAGFVEVPEHIYIASQLGPHKEPYVTVDAVRNDSREDPFPRQRPGSQDTAKQPFKSLGRYIGNKSTRGRKALKDAAQRLRKRKSFGDLLERPGTATQVQPAAQARQAEDTATTSRRDQASDAPSDDSSAQAANESLPRATNRAEHGTGESREPLLPPNNDATAATRTSHDGANENVQQPTSAQSLVSVSADGTFQTALGTVSTDLSSYHQAASILAPAAIADLNPTAPASSNTPPPPPNDPTHEPIPAPSSPASPRTASPSPSLASHDSAPSTLTAPFPPYEEWATYGGDQAIPSFQHVEFIGEPDSFFDLAWGVVSGLTDAPIPLPR